MGAPRGNRNAAGHHKGKRKHPKFYTDKKSGYTVTWATYKSNQRRVKRNREYAFSHIPHQWE